MGGVAVMVAVVVVVVVLRIAAKQRWRMGLGSEFEERTGLACCCWLLAAAGQVRLAAAQLWTTPLRHPPANRQPAALRAS
ncbi:hypothetical protein F4780DRAFT_736531 [Xylariomycetidae sp. FL0641]|nr:hypothetical protein F4780DRAFT_736531 [Xylariomycetidae sp. FL0641]